LRARASALLPGAIRSRALPGTAQLPRVLPAEVLLLALLSGALLSSALLSGALLSGALLSGALLSSALLTGALLSGALLIGALLIGALLIGALLPGALPLVHLVVGAARVRVVLLPGTLLPRTLLPCALLVPVGPERLALTSLRLTRHEQQRGRRSHHHRLTHIAPNGCVRAFDSRFRGPAQQGPIHEEPCAWLSPWNERSLGRRTRRDVMPGRQVERWRLQPPGWRREPPTPGRPRTRRVAVERRNCIPFGNLASIVDPSPELARPLR
jgi:hypothetical protein